ncbi:MAG: hypothetical protein NTW04_01700 [Elusimicrobia bacterium]|nr:hypothetical protein [Elusimicrobiota bacterium]
MNKYWTFSNDRNRHARAHRDDCPHAKNRIIGKGNHWFGPYGSKNDAIAKAIAEEQRLGVYKGNSTSVICTHCQSAGRM